MRKFPDWYFTLILGFHFALIPAFAESPEYAPGEVLVKFEEGVSGKVVEEFAEEWEFAEAGRIPTIGLHRFKVLAATDLEALLSKLEKDPRVERVELNLIRSTESLANPSDPHFNYLWHLDNNGQIVNGWQASAGIDIQWPEAMEIYEPQEAVTVAVLDSGVALDHPELFGQSYEDTALWVNDAELNGRAGYDDDGNGFTDDIWGWDFYDSDNLPLDENGHGTLVASIISGIADNGIEGVGVCPDAKIMSLRVGDDLGKVSIYAWMSAMEYAAANGARILNCSFGGPGYSQFGQSMIREMENQGILVVCAAGNDSRDNDIYPSYPASYNGNNLLSVASVDPMGNLSYFSNYGRESVHLAAPGSSIFGAGISRDTYFLEDFDGSVDGWQTYPMEDNYSSFVNWSRYEYEYGNYALADSVNAAGGLAFYEGWTHTVAQSPRIDLSGLSGPLLQFDILFQLEPSWLFYDTDQLFVEASLDGYEWDLLSTIYGSGANGEVRRERIDLSRFENQSIYIRFRLRTDFSQNYLGVYIDNFEITRVKTFEYSGEEHQFNNGTSFAAPIVTGMAALLLAERPELEARDLKLIMLLSAFIGVHPSLEEKLVSEGMANAHDALSVNKLYSKAVMRIIQDSTPGQLAFREHPWLGLISATDYAFAMDWIYHGSFGWVFCQHDSDSSIYLYTKDFGWIWVSEETSPWGFFVKERRWEFLAGITEEGE